MSKTLSAVGLAALLVACAGRPSFEKPACAQAYDDCVESCEDRCPQGEMPGVEPLYNELQVDCAACVNRCRAAGEKCERRVSE